MEIVPKLAGVSLDEPFTMSELIFHSITGKHRHKNWPKIRREWLEKNSRCAVCDGRLLLEVHHIQPFHLWPELELVEGNLITLCDHPTRQCHLRWGHLGYWLAYNPLIRSDVERIQNRPTQRDDTLFE